MSILDTGFSFRNEKLMVQPFDKNRLEFTGEATPIADNVESSWLAGPDFSVSGNNVLVYGRATQMGNAQPIWFDRSGKSAYLPLESQVFMIFAICLQTKNAC